MLKITEYFINNSLITNLVTVLIVAIGIVSFSQLNRATYPEVNFDVIKITTAYPGASAEDVEIKVTKKIEEELEDLEDIDKVLSSSIENLSVIYVFIDLNARNAKRVKEEVNRAIDRVVNLPAEVESKPKIDELRSSNVSIIELAVIGDVAELMLRKTAKNLKNHLSQINGVGKIELVGYRDREVHIGLDVNKLDEHYVSIDEVLNAIAEQNIRVSGGNLKSRKNQKKIVTDSEFIKPVDVAQTIIRSNTSGQSVELSEIAEIKNTFEDAQVLSRTNSRKSINLLIRSQLGTDIIDTSETLRKEIKVFQENISQNIKVEIVSDFSKYTKSLLGIVQNNALIGFLLVLTSLFIFLTRYTALWTAVGIPLSLFAAFSLFPFFNIDINFISLLTLVLILGLLVDDAIVVAENITRHKEMGKSPMEAARTGLKEVFWPVTVTIITTILAFAPMFAMKGITGRFIEQIPLVVILTLIFSLLECTLILPAHIVHSPVQKPRKLKWFENFKDLYVKTLKWALTHRMKTVSAFLLFLMFSFFLMIYGTKVVLFPYDDIDLFYVLAEMPQGTSLEETRDKMKSVEKLVAEIPKSAIEGYTTRVGHHDTDVYGATSGLHSNWAMVSVYLRPSKDRELTSESIMDNLQKKIDQLQGFDKIYLEKFNDGPPVGKAITINIVSDNDGKREQYSQDIVKELKTIKGVMGLDYDGRTVSSELRIQPDFELMARLGIQSADISRTVRAAFDGLVVTELTREGEEIEYRVRLKDEQRKSTKILEKLQVRNQTGRLIPLSTFTQVVPFEGRDVIKHFDSRRTVLITADVDGDVITSLEANKVISDLFLEKINNDPDVDIIFGGEEKSTQESFESFYIAFPFALAAIFCILVILFNSLKLPFVIMAAIPFGICGVIISLFTHGLPFSFLAIIGTLGLIGIVVNDSLVMVSHLNQIHKEKHTDVMSYDEIVLGARNRFRAVLLTTVTTVAGMIPTIYGFGGYEPFVVPIVLSVAGGLVFATVITLILVPILYSFAVGAKAEI